MLQKLKYLRNRFYQHQLVKPWNWKKAALKQRQLCFHHILRWLTWVTSSEPSPVERDSILNFTRDLLYLVQKPNEISHLDCYFISSSFIFCQDMEAKRLHIKLRIIICRSRCELYEHVFSLNPKPNCSQGG